MAKQIEKISVLVAAWNEEKHLEAFLGSYTTLDYPNKELLLCAGGQDDTFKLAQRWADTDIRVLEQHRGEGKFRALQRCLGQATGSIIMLTDADTILNSDSFSRLLYPILAEVSTATTGNILPLPGQLQSPFVYAQWVLLQGGLDRLMTISTSFPFLIGQNSAVARNLLEDAYETPLSNLIGEDAYLSLYLKRGGHQILRVSDSYVETRFPETFSQYVRQRSRWRRHLFIPYYQNVQMRSVWKAAILVCKDLVWLCLPFSALILSIGGLADGWAIGLTGWILIWGFTFTGYIRRFTKGQKSVELDKNSVAGQEYKAVPILSLFKIMFANWFAALHLALCMAVPTWRHRW